MNPNAQSYRVRPCFVCGFPFSDVHHIHPELLGRENSPTIVLCPNHHRLAHIVQGMLVTGYSESSISKFAEQTFDASFNEIALELLFAVYEELKQRLLRQFKFNVGDAVMVCIDCDHRNSKHNYNCAIVEQKGVFSSVVYIAVNNTEFEIRNQEIEIIGSGSSQKDIKAVAGRIKFLVQNFELESIEYDILANLQKSKYFTPAQLEYLKVVEESYAVDF